MGGEVWKDSWCGSEPLSASFPSLYAIVDSKDAWVREYLVWT